MEIRCFKKSDTVALIELFRTTVHTVCSKEYSQEQLNVWAPEKIDSTKWQQRLENTYTIVAEHEGQIAGFANLEADGCIDMFYVSASTQSKGVGTALFNALESEAKSRGLERLHSDVSLTARNFFISKGFAIENEYFKKVANVTFPNAIMAKRLN